MDDVKVEYVELPQYLDERGILSVAEFGRLPFIPQRAFWVSGVPEEAERGGHAHRTCSEVFFAVSGSVRIDLSDGKSEVSVELSDPNRGIVIPAMVWCRLYAFSRDFLGLCFASEPYSQQGYFKDWATFVSHLEQD